MTQARAAARLGWKAPQLSAIETGRRAISLTELADICDRLGIQLGTLLDPGGIELDDDTRRRVTALRAGMPAATDPWQAPPETDDERRALERARLERLEARFLRVTPDQTRDDLRGWIQDELQISDDETLTLLDIREREVQVRLAANAEGDGWGGTFNPESSLDVSAVRGHVTRDLIQRWVDYVAPYEPQSDRTPF